MAMKDNSKIIKNPILDMDYPDPDVIRVDDTYYMVTTTMHFMPGCDILRSYDLINWEHLTYVYDRLDSTEAERLEGDKNAFGKGMWAASIRYHEGLFYIVFVANDTQKTYLYRSGSIEGPWQKSNIEGFYHDASLLFDEGRTYIVYGNTDVYLTELNDELTAPKKGGLHRLIVSDKGNPNLGYEGSHLYKIDGRYYLFLIHSARDRWMRNEACFISDSLTGEFTGGDVLSDDMGFLQSGAAQGGIVDDGNGKYYSIVFQDSGAIGRVPVVVPVEIKDGNVKFGIDGKVPKDLSVCEPLNIKNKNNDSCEKECSELYGSDDFKECYLDEYKKINLCAINETIESSGVIKENEKNSGVICGTNGEAGATTAYNKRKFGTFGFKSFWQFSHEPDLSFVDVDTDNGILSIETGKTSSNIFEAKNVLTQRMKRPHCEAEVTIDGSDLKNGDSAGLTVYQGDFAWVGITKKEGKLYAVMRNMCSDEDTWILTKNPGEEHFSEMIEGNTLRVKLCADFPYPFSSEANNDKADNDKADIATCSIFRNGKWEKVGISHQMKFRLDHFTGARFGLFVYSSKEAGGRAGFSDFKYVTDDHNS
ncbi:family 43 glycosylhydrolase [Eubacterium sp.]|uniref:glycoside hydrolase family 43 protein n=1 Tax=Eubacterium sp. TaxID=142586 RepID=UPI00338FC2DF|nr:glycoside hydrolase 43 family protein [Eubacterium sp.]